jgi:outer membrane protein assembly factor BamA
MLNKLNYGEYIFINFERLRPEQQNFELQFNYPYLLDLPFAIDTELNIFRNALNFSTLRADLGVQYLINSTDYLKVSWNYESSDLIEVDTAAIKSSRQLPVDLDFNQTGFAVEFFMNRLDYRFNPRSGYRILTRGVIGQRTIKLNPQIIQLEDSDGFDFEELYQDIESVSPRFELSTDVSYFQPLSIRSALGFHFKGAWLYNSQGILRNEKYQIGGNKILRGFDEAAFFTSYYAVSTLEYRLLLSSNSYFSVPFIDFGYFELDDGTPTYGLGIGGSLGFETKVGLFNFSVATGRTSDIGFDLSRPKAHFGFISLF